MPQTIGADGRIKDRTGIAPQGGVFAVSGLAGGAQSIPNVTWTKIQWLTRDFDPFIWWDATNFRFQPKVPGYYRVTVSIQFNAAAQYVLAAIYKNGISLAPRSQMVFNATTTNGVSPNVSPVVYLNGTTDYLETWGYQASGAALNVVGGFMDANLVGVSTGVVPEPWHIVGTAGEPAMQNGWGNYQSSLAYMKDPNNFVHIKGELQTGTLTAGTAIFTIPAG